LLFKNNYLNIPWIKRGIVVALPFLIISVAQLTMDFSDRYLIDYFLGKEKVGVYSFFYGIANVPTTLITSVLLVQYYPVIINIYKFNTEERKKQKIIRNFLVQCLGFGAVINIIILFFIPFLLDFIGKKELLDEIGLFYLMLIQVMIFAGQVVVQTILYARNEDKFLLYSAVAGSVLNIVLNIFLIPAMGIKGAAVSTISSMTLMLVMRLILLQTSKTNARDNFGTI
jgi:O-antigen/teichoic acid export membrane protein